MQSTYVTKKLDDLTYEPLMNGIDTIEGVWQKDMRIGEGFVYHLYNVLTSKTVFIKQKNGKKKKIKKFSDYFVKMRIFADGFIQASCDCPDFYYRCKREKDFCKHIYAVKDDMNQKNNK